MSSVSMTNVMNISVSAAQLGAAGFNTSNLALFTREVPAETFGANGYKIYKSAYSVGVDFGTSSVTARMANKVFSQSPNILTGGGSLIVILFADTADVVEVQKVEFPTVPTAGNYKLKYGSTLTSQLTYSSDAAAVQAALRAITGLSSVTVTGNTTTGFIVTFTGVSGNATLLTVEHNSLQDTNTYDVIPTVTTTTAGTTLSTETLNTAITRTSALVSYCGVMAAEITSQADMLAAAASIQTMSKIAFFTSTTAADLEVGGMLDRLRSGAYSKSRGLFHGASEAMALNFMAAYAGRALSTNFSGSKTVSTMHLKDMVGVDADTSIDETKLAKAQAAGVDVYVQFEGGPAKVYSSGLNTFFDRVYCLMWWTSALQIAGFNVLAKTGTKIPQTEDGMAALIGSYRKINEQAVTNGYAAPGTWTSPDTFGNPEDFTRNISERGHYIYHQPIALQSATDREDRKAPVVQIALKESGAIHSGTVIVNVNA